MRKEDRSMSRKRVRSAAIVMGLAVAVVATAFPGAADDPPEKLTPESLAAHWTRILTEPLGLDDEQVSKLHSVLVGDYERKAEIFARYKGRINQDSIGRLRVEVEDSQQQTRSELQPFLSAEQLDKFDSLQQERQAQTGGALMVYRLQDRLGLTAEQHDALVPIFAGYVAKQQALVQETRGGGGRGGGTRNMRALRGKSQQLQSELSRQLEPILSAEQMQAYGEYQKEMQAQGRHRMRSKGFQRP
jgi:hypothetical protein